MVPAIQEFAQRRGQESGFLGAVSYLEGAADHPDAVLLGEEARNLFDAFRLAHGSPEQVTAADAEQFVQRAENLTGNIRQL